MKKTSAIALAIAGTVATPVAVADGGGGLYISARAGVEQVSHDADAKEGLTFGNLSSRLGWKGETDLGNGWTTFAHLEAAADGFGLRNLHVGMKGDFGSIKIGEKTYAAFYNHVTAPVDPMYWVGAGGLVQTGRTSKVINYSGGTGAVSFDVAVEADGPTEDGSSDDGVVGTQLGVTIGLGDWNLSLGTRDAEDAADSTDGTVTGVTLHGALGDASLAVSVQQSDGADGSDGVDGVHVVVGLGPFIIDYGMRDDGSSEPSKLAVQYSQSIGRNTTFWAEAESADSDGGDDSTTIVGAIRYDWN